MAVENLYIGVLPYLGPLVTHCASWWRSIIVLVIVDREQVSRRASLGVMTGLCVGRYEAHREGTCEADQEYDKFCKKGDDSKQCAMAGVYVYTA